MHAYMAGGDATLHPEDIFWDAVNDLEVSKPPGWAVQPFIECQIYPRKGHPVVFVLGNVFES